MLNYHKPNKEWLAAQAKAARDAADKKGGGSGDFQWYDWNVGSNLLRVLPAWSMKGHIAKLVHTHYDVGPNKDRFRCPAKMWPDVTSTCEIDDALDKVLAKMPNLDLWHLRSGPTAYVNVIDREEEPLGPKICRLPIGQYNWLMLQMDHPDVGDVTDPLEGFDIDWVKKVKDKGKKLSDTSYHPTLIPRQKPLHEDEAQMEQWLEGLYDLDTVFRYPDDAGLAAIHKAGAGIVHYYFSQAAKDNDTAGKLESKSDDVKAEKPQETAPEPEKPDTGGEPPAADGARPECFAGAVPVVEKDGEKIWGYQGDEEKCLLCECDFDCMDAGISAKPS